MRDVLEAGVCLLIFRCFCMFIKLRKMENDQRIFPTSVFFWMYFIRVISWVTFQMWMTKGITLKSAFCGYMFCVYLHFNYMEIYCEQIN